MAESRGEMVLKFGIVIEVDLSPLDRLDKAMGEGEDDLAQLVEDTGAKLKEEWTAYAGQMLKKPGGYAQAIQEGEEYPFEQDPLHFVIINDHQAARWFEEGVRPFDIKGMLGTSGAVRIARDGTRYVVIPFKHSVSQLTAAGIDYSEVRNLNPSFFRRGAFPGGSRAETQNTDPRKRAHSYTWGDPLTDLGTVGMRRKGFGNLKTKEVHEYTWKASPFERLYSFQQKDGGSEYATFRTISDKSEPGSWQHPGIRAMAIAETAVNIVRPDFMNEAERITERILSKFERMSG